MLLEILLSSKNDIWSGILTFLVLFPVLLFSLSAHEYGHGFAAYTQGDGYAKMMGRLSLNPFKHLDPWGTLSMLLFGFGWAKPVPIVPTSFKNGRKSMIIVSLAGITVNLILAIIALFLWYFFRYLILANVAWFVSTTAGILVSSILLNVLSYTVQINIALAVFNLVPIPPLDGYKFFKEIFIGKISYNFFLNFERYSTFILIGFLLIGDRTNFISSVSGFIYDLMIKVMDLIFIAFV